MSNVKEISLFINGEFKLSTSGEFTDVINPSTEEVIAKSTNATSAEVKEAIDAAKRAQLKWEKIPAVGRGAYLHKIADGIRKRADEITHTIMQEGGKTFGLAETETYFTADYLDYMAEWARRYEGEILQSDRPKENIFVFKKPIGVIAAILPWNFPFFLIARKAGPAMVTGNTIVLKPSSITPIIAQIFAEIVQECKVPAGVFNVVMGRGSVIGDDLAGNPDVGMISLTGSLSAGQAVMRAAAENITKVSLELGGKAPALVLKDADIDLAVKCITASRIINAGQVCNCAERVYVQEDIKDEFLAKLKVAFEAVKFANPEEVKDIDMGPLVDEKALKAVDDKVKQAISEGGTLYYGGGRAGEKGYFYNPTIITDCKNDMTIMHEEIFGPVLPVATFKTIDEALGMANDCEYGLTSSIYTTNLNNAFKVIRGIKFGETYVNRENFEAMQGFHAGMRKSGIGGADGKHGLEEYLTTHVVYIETQDE